MVAESSYVIHFMFSSVIFIQITVLRYFFSWIRSSEARLIFPFFLLPKLLTNIPWRSLGSAQLVLFHFTCCKILSQALTFFSQEKPHFFCKSQSSTVHSLSVSEFQFTKFNFSPSLHLTNIPRLSCLDR